MRTIRERVEPKSLILEELISFAEDFLSKHPDGRFWVKWTCAGCGERATSTEENVIHSLGYRHDESYCGRLSGPEGRIYGIVIAVAAGVR